MIFEAIWCRLGLILDRCLQNGAKSGCWFESCFWSDLGIISIDILRQHDMAKVANSLQKHLFFNIFGILVVVLLGWFVDGFVVGLGVESQPNIYHKSIIKAIKKQMWFGMDFERILMIFGIIVQCILDLFAIRFVDCKKSHVFRDPFWVFIFAAFLKAWKKSNKIK